MAYTGKLHSPDEVYTVEVYRHKGTGVAVVESWEMNGKTHRIGGPAKISRDADTGLVVTEGWFRDNQLHRDDGPATIVRDPATGKIKRSSWFMNGKKIPAPRQSRAGAVAQLPSRPKGPTG
jgi:hypothetical protein